MIFMSPLSVSRVGPWLEEDNPLISIKVLNVSRVTESQSSMVLLPDAIIFPSGENATALDSPH